jgi:hypothetical protein
MDPRIIVRIEITKETWAQIGRLTEKFGMTQVYALADGRVAQCPAGSDQGGGVAVLSRQGLRGIWPWHLL